MAQVLSREALKTLSLDEVLNINLDEVPNAGFTLWPDGTYNVTFFEPETDKVGKDEKDRLVIKYVLDEVVELADPSADAMAVGSENQLGYILPIGISNFKTDFDTVRAAMGASTALDVANQLKGYKASITLGHRLDKDDKEKKYQSVKAITPLA